MRVKVLTGEALEKAILEGPPEEPVEDAVDFRREPAHPDEALRRLMDLVKGLPESGSTEALQHLRTLEGVIGRASQVTRPVFRRKLHPVGVSLDVEEPTPDDISRVSRSASFTSAITNSYVRAGVDEFWTRVSCTVPGNNHME